MINYHHIGGRNGTYPLPLKAGALLQDFHLILYDADANCFKQMEKANQGDWGKISVYPYCIGGTTGRAAFNLNFHPTTNSLYPFNEEYAAYGYVNNPRYGEYVLGDACKQLSSVELELLSLRDAMKISNISAVDFLSLDVQGAEFDILNGADALLQTSCVGIQLEAEFAKLYRGQKTFADINSLLENIGFELIDLESFGRCAPISMPIGYRGLEQVLSAEAIYIKKLDQLVKNGNIEQIWKAAFFNLIYKKIGLCLKYIEKAIELENGKSVSLKHEPLYMMLLRDIWTLYEEDRLYTFPSIGQLFSHEAFQTYYCQGKSAELSRDESLKNKLDQLAAYVETLQKNEDSPLEALLKRYELYVVAQTAKHNRVSETDIYLELVNRFS